jgi:hypothetical protein
VFECPDGVDIEQLTRSDEMPGDSLRVRLAQGLQLSTHRWVEEPYVNVLGHGRFDRIARRLA